MSSANFTTRSATIERKTAETEVSVKLTIDGTGEYKNETGIGFLDHMLDLFAKHGGFDLEVACSGDLDVDDHHTAEDIGICLGQAFAQALGNKEHIGRFGHAYVPMDEALARSVVDLSGRFAIHFECSFSRELVGDLSTEMVPHFWGSFAEHLACNLHVSVFYGENDHHKIEAIFKSAARALKMAVLRDPASARVASTKGVL